jgi:multidrug efflux pump subunit AcrA (membrane-fusion protein)
MWSCVL